MFHSIQEGPKLFVFTIKITIGIVEVYDIVIIIVITD
jgi:hypothetical protein